MAAAIDALTSPTLKHLREAWWATYSGFGADAAKLETASLMLGTARGSPKSPSGAGLKADSRS